MKSLQLRFIFHSRQFVHTTHLKYDTEVDHKHIKNIYMGHPPEDYYKHDNCVKQLSVQLTILLY
jgi:hypothetical protein